MAGTSAGVCEPLDATAEPAVARASCAMVVRPPLLYDIGVPIVLIWYWFTFFKNAFGKSRNPNSHEGSITA